MYIIDSNVLIEAKKTNYAFDLAPGFWEWLDLHHHEGTLASIEQVKSEIIQGNDKLSEWAKEHPDFSPHSTHAQSKHFGTSLPERWRSTRNPLPMSSSGRRALVAYGAAHGHTIVTQEIDRSGSKKRIKILDAWASFGVRHMSNFAMLHDVGIRLVI